MDALITLSRLVEGLIFASAEPVSEGALRQFLVAQGAEETQLGPVLQTVMARYEDHAVELVAVAKGWQFRTRPELAPALTRIIEKPRRLSRSAMETLAIIAYHQLHTGRCRGHTRRFAEPDRPRYADRGWTHYAERAQGSTGKAHFMGYFGAFSQQFRVE